MLRRFKTEEVWPEALLAQKPERRRAVKTLYDVLVSQYAGGQQISLSELKEDQLNDESSREPGLFRKKGCLKNTPGLSGHGHLAPFEITNARSAALAGRRRRARNGVAAKATTRM